MRTARISDLGRGHPRAEFVPTLRVESFHRSDSEGCTIVIIERHSPDRFSTGPLYICALYAHAGWPPPESSCSIEPITACLLHQEPPRLGSRLAFWRTTGVQQVRSELADPRSCAAVILIQLHASLPTCLLIASLP